MFPRSLFVRLVAVFLACGLSHAAVEFACEDREQWQATGDVTVEGKDVFAGAGALRLNRTLDKVHEPVSAVSATFAVAPGTWEVKAAGRTDLYSPDTSYNGTIVLEILDKDGKAISRETIFDAFGKQNWRPVAKDIEVPEGGTSARFAAAINKSYGSFWVDQLSMARREGATQTRRGVERMLVTSRRLGNLLYPEDPRVLTINALAGHEVESRTAVCVVRDYWGAEMAEPVTVTLEAKGAEGKFLSYQGTVDLSQAPLEIGKYYELHVTIPQKEGDPFRDARSFAILPEAVTKQYRPEQIPFTSRNWDNRIPEFYELTNRIGVRICGIWGRWSPVPPYPAQALQIGLCEKFGMGALTSTPIAFIERRSDDYEKFDEKALREGVRQLIKEIGPVRPLFVNLGNEPHGTGEVVRRNVEAYRIVYEEIKKVDPGIFVLSSSTNPQEEYFQLGFGKWCDAYDFHTYGDTTSVREIIRQYHELFKKYGHSKPIWATEVGLNSQGIERRVVAGELIRKVATFFAAGGANISWFGLLFPDNDAKLYLGSEDTHNVFDCRYRSYTPRMDAIAYYNVVNAIAVKKFAGEKTYPGDIKATLFRDEGENTLFVLWKETGLADVQVPLPGVRDIEVIRIDGSRRKLDADGRVVTLTVSEDPLLLLCKGGTLPKELLAPEVELAEIPRMVAGTSATLVVKGPGAVDLQAPPFWDGKKTSGDGMTTFVLSGPEESRIREADLLFLLKDAEGRVRGELSRRPAVTGRIALRVLPEPASANTPPGIRLLIENNGPDPQKVQWEAQLKESFTLAAGKFDQPGPPEAYFAESPQGTREIPPGKTETIFLPLKGVDPHKIYRVSARANDASGRSSSVTRLAGGFAGVPKAAEAPVLDGKLDEAAWRSAPAQTIDRSNQFNPARKTSDWKNPEDLSGTLRFLWDDRNLYLGVSVTDDIAGALKEGEHIWAQDGLQFLVDPSRESELKPGKYDYAVALGTKGPETWCYLSADAAGAPTGLATDVKVAALRQGEGGNITYEIAIPWPRLAPFRPAPGANLGLTMILNEDDGAGRDSFMTWFGNAHTKQVDTAGDLILQE